MKLIKIIGLIGIISLALVGCSKSLPISHYNGIESIRETALMQNRADEDRKLLKENELGDRLRKMERKVSIEEDNWELNRKQYGGLLYTHRLYRYQMNEDVILEAFGESEFVPFIERCRAIESNDVKLIGEVFGDYAITYKVMPKGIYDDAYEMSLTATVKDIQDETYAELIESIRTPAFLTKTISLSGETKHITLGNAMELGSNIWSLYDVDVVEAGNTYIIPEKVRYEIFVKDKIVEKVKVYMVKQKGLSIQKDNLGPLYNINKLVDEEQNWSESIQTMYDSINTDQKIKTQQSIGEWRYTLKVLPQTNKLLGIEENYIEIILEP